MRSFAVSSNRRVKQIALFPLAAALLLGTGCAAPIHATRVGAAVVERQSLGSALTHKLPSMHTRQILGREDLVATYEANPRAAIIELHKRAIKGDRDLLLALAELSYLIGEQSRDRADYLGATVYAYLYLFDEKNVLEPLDPRVRLAADLYNLSLAKAFVGADGESFELRGGTRSLPVGTMSVTADRSGLLWHGATYSRLLPSLEFGVEGLRARYRYYGLGAPLIALFDPTVPIRPHEGGNVAQPSKERWATAVLRVDGGIAGLRAGKLSGTLQIYDPLQKRSIEINGQAVPLEADPTAVLAHSLGTSQLWGFELGGFFSADKHPFEPGLLTPEGYQRGKIPVVFIHGTASSPARWAEMYNALRNDAVIGERYQFWFFMYETGSPILFSARYLRDSLRAVIKSAGGVEKDPALGEMVLVGHSQGGLLARLMVTESSDLFFRNISKVPIEELKIDADQRALIEATAFFHPEPYVERVVFIATPHRGSYQASTWITNVIRRFVGLPVTLLKSGVSLLQGNAGKLTLDRLPTSIENMRPGHPFLKTYDEAKMSDRVWRHSIIAVRGGPSTTKGGDDGVVAYESAHLDDVDSELVINSSHSVQGHPLAISEMRRILLQHLQAVDSGQTRREPPKSTGVGAAAAARVGAGDAPAASSGH